MIRIMATKDAADLGEQFDINATITINDGASAHTCIEAFVRAMQLVTYSEEEILSGMMEYLEEQLG